MSWCAWLKPGALRISRQVEGERHPDVGHALLNRAAIASSRQDVAAAEQADREALDIFTKWYGETHPETASARTMLARALRRSRDASDGGG